ncbi:hypothetical protein SBOR_8425 [Sclerotinia borealis F-4128]|uniref:Secreted protein n=1 Tax=Sclerotinia borealis (strain F-4128) TaxID=1432307 RepID=W9C328_SCLBF|nr:hypothetical protein SBOR_8425 [Sclerotinia borealis F-4128]
MANRVYYELSAEAVDVSTNPISQSRQQQQQQQQQSSLSLRKPLTPPPDNDEPSTIRGVPGDELSLIPQKLFTRRSKSNLLSQSKENIITETISTNPFNRPISTTPSSETNTSTADISLHIPGSRLNLNYNTGPALPPRRISQYNPNEVHYTRDSHRVIAYLIPLPKPINVSDAEFPQRYLIYTPPAAHLLEPAEGIKEGNRHKGKRFWQREVKKAKTYDGKTMSLKGLHSKTTRGVLRGIDSIKNTDMTFLNRVPRKEIEELHLIYPSTTPHSPSDLRTHFLTHLTRSKTLSKKHVAISTLLLLPTLLISTLSTIIWPFGGLFEVDAIWTYTSIRGYLVSRSITKRLLSQDTTQNHNQNYNYSHNHNHDPPPSIQDRELHLHLQQNEEIRILEKYVQELCHTVNPARFASPGMSITEDQVLRAMGWEPDLRGRVRSGERGGMPEGGVRDWDDERWQEREARDDLVGVLGKEAKSWDGWCKRWEKNPKKAEKR